MTTTQVLRPSSDDIAYGTITRSSGAVNFSLIDDAPSDDTSYITAATPGAGVVLGLTNLSALTGTQRIQRVKMRARYFHNSADVGHIDKVDGRLRDNLTGKQTKAFTFQTSSNTAVESSSGWYTADPAGAAWTEAFVNRMQVAYGWRTRNTGVTELRITEGYVDVEVHDQPAVSAVTITGATTTTTPDVSWTYTTTDDTGGQTRYQVKIFSAAQYGAAGFSPDFSTATWDSGVLSGSVTVLTVGTNLLNGVTYKAYVQAARDWPGPAGPLWWSAWASSSATAVTLTPPPAPTITVTQQLGLPYYRNVIRASAAINLLTANQASLETDTTGWAATSNCAISRSTSYFVDGAASLQMSSSAAGTMTAETSARPQVEPGAQMTAVATVRSAVSVRTVRVGIRWYDIAGALIGSTNFGSPVSDATGSDTTPTVTATAPSNAYTAAVVLEVQSTGAGSEIHRWDKIDMHYGSGTGWTPGGYKDSAQIVVYRALRVSKTIGRSPVWGWMHPQHYSGGALTGTPDGFTSRAPTTDTVRFAPLDQAPPESPANTTGGMICWDIRSSTSLLDICIDNLTAADGTHPYLLPTVPGLSATGSVWLWASAAITVRLQATPVDRYNTVAGSGSLSSDLVLTTTPQKLSVTMSNPPAGTAFTRLAVENRSATTGVTVFLTNVRWSPTAAPAGETWPGQVFAWETETVRVLTTGHIADGQNDVVIVDHEAPPQRPVMYWARVTATTATGQATASLDGTAVHVYNDPPTRLLIGDPWQPENAAICNMAPGDQAQNILDAAELHPSGRDGDPVLVTTWSGQQRSYTLSALNHLEYYRLVQLLPSTRQLYWKWPEGGITYGYVTSWSPTRTRPGFYKTIAVQVLETARPA